MTDETQEINYRSVDGTPLTPELIRRSVTEVFECVRCQRKISIRDAHKKSGGLIYLDAASDYSCAACQRCMRRKRNETMRLFQAELKRSIQADNIRENARWN